MALQNIDVAKESSISNLFTTLGTINDKIDTLDGVADNIYAKVDTEVASVVSNTATNNTASKTGTLSQKESYAIGLLENTTYGLNAIKSALGSSSSGAVKSVQRGVLSPTSTSANISISAVTPTKCLVLLDNGIVGYGTRGSSSSTTTIYGATVTSLDSTKLTISTPYYRYDSGCSYGYTYYKVGWQVIEFY